MFQGGKNKVSQETQSPVTKLFKSLACSDFSSETVNLVKQKKKKLPTSSQPLSKCECTDIGQQTSVHKTGSVHNRDDTFSFTSCSLKKLLASESPRLMMALIIAVGFLTVVLVLKCICCPAVGVDLVQETRERRSNDVVANDLDRKPWETSKTKLMSEFSELTGKDTRDTHLQSGDGDYPEYLSPDLASVLDPIKVNEGYGSNSLRDFYRKLLKTDIQIKNLKKGFANIKRGNIDLSDPNTPRLKRSPSIFSATNERYPRTLSNEDIKENFSKYDPKSDTLKTEKVIEKNTKYDFDTGIMIDSNSNLEKVKAFMKEKKLQHDAKELENNELLNSFKFENSQLLRNNLKNHKHMQRLDIVFGRVTPSTQHRRLLQHDDKDDDDEDTTEDYEEQTKEPWDREKRTVTPLEINIKTERNLVTTNKSTKPKTSNFKEQTTHYNEEINFLIEAALKMKPDNTRGKQIKLKNDEANTAKGRFFKFLRQKTFVNNIYSGIKSSNSVASKTPSPGETINSSDIDETSISQGKVNQKTIQKHKEHNVMYSGHKRSLKSIEDDKVNEGKEATISDVETTVIADRFQDNGEHNLTYFNKNITLETINEYNTSVANKNKSNIILALDHEDKSFNLSENTLKLNNSTSWGLGEIFSMLADFFMFLSGFDTNQEDSGYRFLYDFVMMLNPNSQRKNETSSKNVINDTKTLTEVSNDLGIKEIVGHRSRVLMSFDDKEENVTSTTDHEKEDMNESYVIANKDLTNASIESRRITNSSSIEKKNAIVVAENRTVVKRSAIGDNIFWNDMYDDEYGIKDPMEDDMKDKSSVKFNDLIGKDNWIGTKFKMIAKSFKDRRNRNMEKKKDRKIKNFRNKTKTHTKRSAPVPNDSGKRMFEGLTANMKRVCHEAAEAIRDTTNREVRADSDQASTLMQQLVGLMSELVDLQVREKTCVQLPEDLRSFLSWLTSPSTEERSDMGFSVDSYDPSPMNNLHNMEDMLSSNTRSDCLGTIHDVEDLILQYDEMSEEDKSKMSGVREYLEHQLHYLHKQLSNFNEFGSSAMYREHPIRRRRQQKSSIVKQNKRKAFKFLNYYGRKHTKHTVTDESLTENYKNMKKNVVRNDNDDIKELKDDSDINDNTDRHLSKKVENSMKKSLNDFFKYLVKDNNTFVK